MKLAPPLPEHSGDAPPLLTKILDFIAIVIRFAGSRGR